MLGAEAERSAARARRRRRRRARGRSRRRSPRASSRCATARGTRIVPLCAGPADERLAAAFGLERPLPLDVEPWRLAEALAAPPAPRRRSPPAPSRGRSRGSSRCGDRPAHPAARRIAIELAVELARGGRHVGLVDADTHAPSIALALGLADEGPGFAAACRQAEFGGARRPRAHPDQHAARALRRRRC